MAISKSWAAVRPYIIPLLSVGVQLKKKNVYYYQLLIRYEIKKLLCPLEVLRVLGLILLRCKKRG